DSTSLTYSIVSPATKGTVTITNTATGAYSYTPNANYNGSDSFTFKANDGTADSNAATVNITVTAVNDAPTAPTLNTPPNGIPNQNEVTITAPALVVNNASDLDGDTLSYTFEIDTVDTFSSPNKKTSSPVAEGAGTTQWTTPALTDNTTWYWRAKANDGKIDGPWMATGSFFVNTANNAPTAPSVNNPADNARVSTRTPTLTINAATDIDYDTLKYEFAVFTDSSLTPQSQVAGATDQGIGWTVDPPLDNLRTYYWTARAKDQHNYLSPWMAAKSFYVDDNGVNDPPTIAIDAPGAGLSPTNASSFTIRWTDADPDSNATITLYFDSDNSGYNGTQIITGIKEDDTANSYTWNTSALPDGNYYVYGMIKDEQSTAYAYSAGPLVIDRTPPSAPVVAGTTPTNNTKPAWSWSSGGGGGNGTYRYKLDDSNLATGATETTATTFTPASAQSEGTHTLYVQERDVAGNWSTSGSFAIVVDTTAPTAPTVTGTSPTNDTTPTWSWSSGGGGNGTYRYKLDDNNLATGATETTATTFTPTSEQSPGTHTLYVQERDAAGSWSASGSFAIVVDTTAPTAPTVTGTSPTNDTTPTWSWSSGGGGGNGTYRYKLDDSNLATGTTETTATTFTPTSAQSPGTHTLYVQERNAAGNWSTTGSFAIDVDTTAPTAPTVTGTTPTNDTTPTWSWSSGGGGGNGTYRYKLDDNNLATGATETTATTFTPTSEQSQGTHTFYVQERDAAGNWSASGSFAIVVDTTAPTTPTVTGTTPTNDTTPTWSWSSGGGNGTFRYKLDDNNFTTGATETTATTFTPSATQNEGSHTLYVQERDAAGNWSASGSFAIVVDTSAPAAPTVTGTTPVNNTTPTWSWSSGGGNGTFRYKLDNNNFTTGATETTATTFTPSAAQNEGSHTLYVQERDAAGNWSTSGSFAIVVDTTAPTAPKVTGTSPINDTTPTWSWSTGGGGGNGTFRYKLDDNNLTAGATETTATTFVPSIAQSEGTHTLYVQERDGAGNWSASGSFAIVVDTTAPAAPTVTGTTPTKDTTPTWNWSSGGNGGNGTFRYKLDDNDLATGATETTATSFTPGAGLTEGSHTLYVQERDAAGNWSARGSFAIMVDTTAPTMNATASYVDSTHVDVSFSETVLGAAVAANYTADNGLAVTEVSQNGATYRLTTSPQAIGTQYTITAKANITDPAGNAVSSSARTASFTRPSDSNGAPGIPSLNSPPDGVANVSEVTSLTPTLKVNASTDPDNDPVTYIFEISTANDFSTVSASQSGIAASGGVASWTIPSGKLVDNTLYYWRCRANDGYRNSGDMPTASFFVNTANDKPTDPGISSPGDNTVVSTLTPPLTVTNAADMDEDTITYEFVVATDSGFANIAANASGIAQGNDGSTPWTVPAGKLADNTQYYWRSRAVDQHGATSNWVSAAFFTNTANDAPTAPTVNTPPNGTYNLNEVVTLTPTLKVNNATDADRDTLSYAFEIDTVNTFDSPNKQTSPIIAEGAGTTSWAVAKPLTDNSVWYWRVKANDGQADGPWMSAQFFVNLQNEAPNVPTIVAPSDNGEVTSTTPTLTVSTTDVDHDAISCNFEIYSDSTLKTFVAGAEVPGTSWKVADNTPLADNTRYYWRAKAKDEHGYYSTWMATSSFTVKNQGVNQPPSITLTAPGAAEPATNATRYTITWNASDPDSPAAQITLYYGNEKFVYDGSQNVTQIVSGIVLGKTSYSWDTSTLPDGAYYVYARIEDGKTAVFASSDGPLVIDRSAPAAPAVSGTTPSNTATPAWSWTSGGNGGNGYFRYRLDNADLSTGAMETTATTFTPANALNDGSHTLYVQERDAAANWSASGTLTIVVDTTAPGATTVSGTTPTNSTTPTWSWSSGGNGGNGTFRYKLDDADLSTGATETTATSFTPTDVLSEATHTLYVQERDAAGNWSATGSFTIVVDTTAPAAPAVAGPSPTNNTRPTWSWTSDESGNGTFRFRLDDADLATGATETAATTFTPAASLSEGTHTLYVQERDTAGNWSASGTLAIVIDTTPPTLNVTMLQPDSFTNKEDLNVSGNAGDLNGIRTLVISASDSGNNMYYSAELTPGNGIEANGDYRHNIPKLSLGANRITIIATDRAGNESTPRFTRNITYDPNGTTLSDISPAADSKIAKSPVDVTGTMSKPASAIGQIEVSVYDCQTESVLRSTQLAEMTDTHFTASVPLVEGCNNIVLTVTDLAGSKGSYSQVVIFDDQKPSLEITYPPKDIRIPDGYLTIKGRVADALTNVTVSITRNGEPLDPPPLVNDGSGQTFEQKLIFPTKGLIYHVIVKATDEAGNESSVPRNITWADPPSGDLNADGQLSVLDVLIALRIAVGLRQPTEGDLIVGDVSPFVNGISVPDGKIDISDTLVILKKWLKIIQQ
ncbi:Ig-like domain-containing protein, partial [Geobacter sp.]|uniref:Ig-like domain-containing protein n=1 Tax=Geobacter sp. TaxID=46610 RepID=UPI002639B2B3